MDVPLSQLDPWFIVPTDTGMRRLETIAEARGIMFLCPKCFVANGMSDVGTHHVVCWDPSVPQEVSPGPGRWALTGTGFEDLTLVAGSSSILLLGGCNWHGFIRNGVATDA